MLIVGWVAFSFVAAIIAGSKGRSGFGYFLLSLALSPLIGLLLAIGLPKVENGPQPGTPTPDTHVKCPDCKELVLKEARVCKHCGCRLTPESERVLPSTEQLLARHGIARGADDKYHFGGHRYDKAEDAIAYAEKVSSENG